jgi:hypothetical protein
MMSLHSAKSKLRRAKGSFPHRKLGPMAVTSQGLHLSLESYWCHRKGLNLVYLKIQPLTLA